MQGIHLDQFVEFNKKSSVTHVSTGAVEYTEDLEDEDTTKFTSHFCFPFDYQFLVKESAIKNNCPYLLLQVNSKDSWNRHRIEGYGFIRFPLNPGYHEVKVETWRPRASLESEIHSFFLGGSARIQKVEELVRTQFVDSNGQADIVNRFGLETEDAGVIRVNINVCT